MATIRKKGDGWQVQIRRKGFPSLSRTFSQKDWARRWAQETERDLERGTVPSSVADLRRFVVGALLVRYRDEVTPRKRGASSETYRLNRLIRTSIASLSLDALSSERLGQYRDARLQMVAGATVRRELAILQHCLDVARREWGVPLPNNPLSGLRLPSAAPGRSRRLSGSELQSLLEAAKARPWYLVPIIGLAIETGMRRSEILGLSWTDVDLDRRLAKLRMTKNGHGRVVLLSPCAVSILAELSRSQALVFPVSANALRLAWERLIRAAGIEDLRFHDLRHEAISRFFEMGLTHPEVALMSGHRDTRMLMRYAHPQQARILARLNTMGGELHTGSGPVPLG